MNRGKRAATTTHKRTVGPPSFTDLPIDRRPLPLAHLRQRGGAVQTKREADDRATDFEAAGAAAGSTPPAPPCSARTRSRGYLVDRAALVAISISSSLIASLTQCHYIIIGFVVDIAFS